jgi:bifunctional UDP-N-acetylglucosamine pyrophosphorylase/glucosamine-1-phosphate N-acetyltransferase
MKAVILAAGEGVRMRPLTLTRPKPLVLVDDKPLLHYLISSFPKEISELIIVIGYLGDQIRDYCGDIFLGRPVTYVEQKQKTGTFDALKLCEPYLKENESFAVFYADDLIDGKTVEHLIKYPLSLVVAEVPDPWRFGVATLRNDGKLKNIEEKPEHPTSNLIVTCAYVLTKEILSYSPVRHPNGEYYLSSVISEFAKNHDIEIIHTSFWLPVGTPEDLELAREVVKKHPELLS